MTYFDTSFVVSLYSTDDNSVTAAKAIQRSQVPRLISALCEFETRNALELRVFRKEIGRSDADSSLRAFDRDVRAGVYRLRSVPDAAFERAHKLSQQFTTRLGPRAIDILHVAIALELGALEFFSFDLRQRKMAEASGLKLFSIPKRP